MEGPRQGLKHQLVFNVVVKSVQEGIMEGTFVQAALTSLSPGIYEEVSY